MVIMNLVLSCACDSIASKICDKPYPNITEIHESGTNCVEASITNIISCSIVHVVLICVAGFLLWKLMDLVAQGVAGYYKRKWNVEDIERKMQADLKEQK